MLVDSPPRIKPEPDRNTQKESGIPDFRRSVESILESWCQARARRDYRKAAEYQAELRKHGIHLVDIGLDRLGKRGGR